MKEYQRCSRCVMDNRIEPGIRFDNTGACYHCQRYDQLVGSRLASGGVGRAELEALISRIKRSGRGREYDCIIGVSGGVDSTYVAFLVKQYGLRPLAVHLDNGWDSELAVKNIEEVLNRLGIDLVTAVLDWQEFKELQVAFLKASVPDGEIPTDHAIFAQLWKEAAQRKIRFIISGMNFATESMSLPDWAYGHSDWKYIKDVNRRFGRIKLRSYPHFGLFRLLWVNAVLRVRTISILNYISYNKDDAMRIIERELGWRNYGGKHHESIYTRFYQGYILPIKFNIDKRYGHYSNLITSNQMTREEALKALDEPPYDPELQRQDLVYVTKKLGLKAEEFQGIMEAPPRNFRQFKNNFNRVKCLKAVVNNLRRLGIYPK